MWVPLKMHAYARSVGVEHTIGRPIIDDVPVLVASWADLKRCRKAEREVIYMEHGAGQSYVGLKSGVDSYIGGNRDGVIGVLVPGEKAKQRQLEHHPEIATFVVGCPKLDAWADVKPALPDTTAAVAHHWNCRIAPETMSAWRYFRPSWKAFTSEFTEVLGHAHPRIWKEISQPYRHDGFVLTQSFDAVLSRAHVLGVDNSSVLFEFAATGRPVVVLNDKKYRRHVEHGGRFWEWADVGIQVEEPYELTDAFLEALDDPPEQAERRQQVVDEVYGVRIGSATSAAVDAICEIMKYTECT